MAVRGLGSATIEQAYSGNEIEQNIDRLSDSVRTFLNYIIGGGGGAKPPILAPGQSRVSLKYKQNIGTKIKFRSKV